VFLLVSDFGDRMMSVMENRPRMTLPEPDRLSDAQKAVYEEIVAGPRGGVRGPSLIWLHSPEFAARAHKVGEFLRWGTVFEPRLSELAILVVARHLNADYVWFNHRDLAADAGLSAAVIEAIEFRRLPPFAADDEAAVYAFSTEILTTHAVGDAAYERIVGLFGERGAVELGALIGYYHLGAIALATARMPLLDGSMKCLPD
jgi:4-carboxymuconolactone decarboxylase